MPPYFSQAVITADRRTANLAFGIRLMPLDEQHAVIERMRAALDPPAGRDRARRRAAGARRRGQRGARVAVAAARARCWPGCSRSALVLLAVHRRAERAWVPLVPIALATGWSALVLFALRMPLNPMSATLGALVIAISTEFAVLLDGRFREERAAGHAPAEALRRTYRSTGAAVLASGATAIAGFAVLALSDVRMLQEFGIVTVVDLSVSLLGVLAVLPAVLVLAERRAARAARPRAARRRPGRAGVKGGWLVGVVGVVVLAYITLNSLRTEGVGSRGLDGGTRLPPFAMPLAASALGRRRQHRHEARQRPAGRAAGVRGPRAGDPQRVRAGRARARSCSRSWRRARALRAARSTCSTGVARALPGVAFAAVAVRGDHERAARDGARARLARCRSATTATARSRTSTASRSAR